MSAKEPQKLGEGSYGCVYKPAFKCEGEKSNKINIPHVGKVFFDDIDAKVENYIAEILQSFGKEANKYLMIPIKICNTDPEENDKIRKCDLPRKLLKSDTMNSKDKYYLENRNSFIQQILPYGGITLDTAIYEKYATLLDWLYALLGTFNAIQFLHSKGYAHLDIKLNNIVLSDTVRLLDFGFMTSLEDIYTDNIRNIHGSYRIYPFELRVQWLKITQQDYSIDEIIDEYLVDYKKLGLIIKDVPELKMKLIRNISNKKLLKKAPVKIDVYSIGMMCIFEPSLLIRFEKEYGFNEYISFIENIIHIDFTERYSPSDAIDKLQKIIHMIEKHESL